ncbi:VOC family protein [Thiohalorhabdus sp. Cl-TMA]|uniref:Aldoketomutase n=1 Tax=Thiohalorhabdus methylotrophus TaxID=3242694 RepID=A0ABV4TZ38_9GAMM
MRIAHTMLRVKSMDDSLDFYTNKLGLELRTHKELPGADADLAFVRDPKSGHEIELTYNHDGRDYDLGDAFGHIAFYVESVDATYEAWQSRGVSFSLAPKTMKNGTRIAFAVDPTGYKIELIEAPEKA